MQRAHDRRHTGQLHLAHRERAVHPHPQRGGVVGQREHVRIRADRKRGGDRSCPWIDRGDRVGIVRGGALDGHVETIAGAVVDHVARLQGRASCRRCLRRSAQRRRRPLFRRGRPCHRRQRPRRSRRARRCHRPRLLRRLRPFHRSRRGRPRRPRHGRCPPRPRRQPRHRRPRRPPRLRILPSNRWLPPASPRRHRPSHRLCRFHRRRTSRDVRRSLRCLPSLPCRSGWSRRRPTWRASIRGVATVLAVVPRPSSWHDRGERVGRERAVRLRHVDLPAGDRDPSARLGAPDHLLGHGVERIDVARAGDVDEAPRHHRRE